MRQRYGAKPRPFAQVRSAISLLSYGNREGGSMRRRKFITLLGGAAAWPLAARAQQVARRPRLAVLLYSTPQRDPNTEAFLRGMRDLGYVDGQNIDIEYR